MTQPMNPNAGGYAGRSEYSWGLGMFPPGIAAKDGGDAPGPNYRDPHYPDTDAKGDNYARLVAQRRIDSTDPSSVESFTVAGNPDNFGKNPPLVRTTAKTEPPPPLPKIPTGVKRAE